MSTGSMISPPGSAPASCGPPIRATSSISTGRPTTGRCAAADLTASLVEVASEAESYSAVLNGRFKGGYITRTYGRPADGIHAVQLELAQVTYMDEDPPYGFREDQAAAIRPVLRRLL